MEHLRGAGWSDEGIVIHVVGHLSLFRLLCVCVVGTYNIYIHITSTFSSTLCVSVCTIWWSEHWIKFICFYPFLFSIVHPPIFILRCSIFHTQYWIFHTSRVNYDNIKLGKVKLRKTRFSFFFLEKKKKKKMMMMMEMENPIDGDGDGDGDGCRCGVR